MKVELVNVVTDDGVRLDGALRRPEPQAEPGLGLDLLICHHGVAGNFYNQYFFDDLGTLLLEEGCAVLRVNNRGHDQVYQSPRGKLGAAYEIVDDCRLDWRAWLDFAESAGYRRVGVWGQSLGAVKTIYYQSVDHDVRVTCAIASSPPRFSSEGYLASEAAEQFKANLERAQELVAAGRPAATFDATVPVSMVFSAGTYLDKYGPGGRYDILNHAPNTEVPVLITLGELEIEGLAFRDLAARGPLLHEASPLVSFELIGGADHSYSTRVPELWQAFRGWLTEAGVGRAAVNV